MEFEGKGFGDFKKALIDLAVAELGPIGAEIEWGIHRPAPEFIEQSTKVESFETGIKVVDLHYP